MRILPSPPPIRYDRDALIQKNNNLNPDPSEGAQIPSVIKAQDPELNNPDEDPTE